MICVSADHDSIIPDRYILATNHCVRSSSHSRTRYSYTRIVPQDSNRLTCQCDNRHRIKGCVQNTNAIAHSNLTCDGYRNTIAICRLSVAGIRADALSLFSVPIDSGFAGGWLVYPGSPGMSGLLNLHLGHFDDLGNHSVQNSV